MQLLRGVAQADRQSPAPSGELLPNSEDIGTPDRPDVLKASYTPYASPAQHGRTLARGTSFKRNAAAPAGSEQGADPLASPRTSGMADQV